MNLEPNITGQAETNPVLEQPFPDKIYNNITVKYVHTDRITKLAQDAFAKPNSRVAFVTSIGPSLSLPEKNPKKLSALEAVFEAAGFEALKQDLTNLEKENNAPMGNNSWYTLIKAPGHNLSHFIYFVIMPQDDKDKSTVAHAEGIKRTLEACLDRSKEDKLTDIVIPNFGTGQGTAREASVNAKHEALKTWCTSEDNAKAGYPKTIILVGNNKETKDSYEKIILGQEPR